MPSQQAPAVAPASAAARERRTLAAAERTRTRHEALTAMLERYIEHAATGLPVHTWPLDTP